MSSSARRRHLLVLPGGLAIGHLAGSGLLRPGTGSAGEAWASDLVQLLVCVGMPLLLWQVVVAARDGWTGTVTSTNPRALVAQQTGAFIVLELLEHLRAGTSPWVAAQSGRFWLMLACHATIAGMVWAALRLSRWVGREMARTRQMPVAFPRTSLRSQVRMAQADFGVALSSLSRRGPPARTVAPQP